MFLLIVANISNFFFLKFVIDSRHAKIIRYIILGKQDDINDILFNGKNLAILLRRLPIWLGHKMEKKSFTVKEYSLIVLNTLSTSTYNGYKIQK